VSSFPHRAARAGIKRSNIVGTAGPFTVAGSLPQVDTESRFSSNEGLQKAACMMRIGVGAHGLEDEAADAGERRI
jgi:transketolase C-terminal domain/subunit